MAEGSHESSNDVNVRAVTRAGLGIGIGVIVTIFLMWFLFDRFAAREARRSPQLEPMAAANPQKQPPNPRLQQNPVKDLATFRAEEDVILNSYALIDPQQGIVHIPVERALELVAKEGLPSRKQERSR